MNKKRELQGVGHCPWPKPKRLIRGPFSSVNVRSSCEKEDIPKMKESKLLFGKYS